jgi:hypothetical protein
MSMKDRCCSKPRNLFSQNNRRTSVSKTSLCYANCVRHVDSVPQTVRALLLRRLSVRDVGGGGNKFLNKPQQNYSLKFGAQTELGILLQLLGVLYKLKKNQKALCGDITCLPFCRRISPSKWNVRFS